VQYTVAWYGVCTDGVSDWILNSLSTYKHDSELQVITAPPLNSTIHKSPQHRLRIFQSAVFTSRSLVTASNSGDSSASALKFSLKVGFIPTLFQMFPFFTASCTALTWFASLPYNSSARPVQTAPFILVCVPDTAGTCLPGRSLASVVYPCLLRICYLETDIVPLFHGLCLETYFVSEPFANSRRDSVVGIATSYGLDDRRVRVRVPIG
jgi:hypothetical protein